MIQELYTNYELSKLLKEKGFEYDMGESHWIVDKDNTIYWISCIGAYTYVDTPNDGWERPNDSYTCITIQSAMKWLRDVHGWFIHIDVIREASCWLVDVRDIKNDVAIYPLKEEFPNYESACEAGIKYCLENLIKND